MIINTPQDALLLLKKLGASSRLIKHHQVVLEAANIIVRELQTKIPTLKCNYQLITIGVALHDAGKITYPEEISGSGNNHEINGEIFLIEAGVEPEIARFCRTHARWRECSQCTLEDLLVAWADTICSGKRNELLAEQITSVVSQQTSLDYWQVYSIVNDICELVTEGSDLLIAKSMI
ncbi:MAG: HD domain-containing protein [Xenococcaceae cyanobacterium]